MLHIILFFLMYFLALRAANFAARRSGRLSIGIVTFFLIFLLPWTDIIIGYSSYKISLLFWPESTIIKTIPADSVFINDWHTAKFSDDAINNKITIDHGEEIVGIDWLLYDVKKNKKVQLLVSSKYIDRFGRESIQPVVMECRDLSDQQNFIFSDMTMACHKTDKISSRYMIIISFCDIGLATFDNIRVVDRQTNEILAKLRVSRMNYPDNPWFNYIIHWLQSDGNPYRSHWLTTPVVDGKMFLSMVLPPPQSAD
jgi:hypothetical protein